MVRPMPFQYRPQSSIEYNRFSNEYFSGADIRLYFGDIWIDEVQGLEFLLQENVAPIYGYASYTWDKVARGTRQVNGTFQINFKKSNYLQTVLERLESKLKDNGSAFDRSAMGEQATIEQLVENMDGDNFDAMARNFEDSLWGEGEGTGQVRVNAQERRPYFYGGEYQKNLRENGFNIVITYGPYNETDGDTVSSTASTLIGVQLTGVSQQMTPQGTPIMETYQFIAKDLNGSVVAREWDDYGSPESTQSSSGSNPITGSGSGGYNPVQKEAY